jgi:hypothetical protein
MQEMERLDYRNRFLPLIRAPKETILSCGVWPHALARVATLPDVIFEVFRSKPELVPSKETGGKEAGEETQVTAVVEVSRLLPRRKLRLKALLVLLQPFRNCPSTISRRKKSC